MTKQTRSGILNALVIFLTVGIVVYLGAANGEIGGALEALRRCQPAWIGIAVFAFCIYLVFESLGVHVFFRQQGLKIRFGTSMLVSAIGLFYSCVTPAATGGQPMQVFCFKKRGIPPGVSSSALAVKFFCFQTALLSLGGLMWALFPQLVSACISKVRVIVITGFVLNGFTVAVVLLLAINKNIVRTIITFGIRLMKKLHLVKDVARATSRADAALADFHASVDMATHHPGRLLVLLLISAVQVLGLMSITYCVYRAIGGSVHLFGEILALQLLLYIAASFTPLPGSSGAQEGGFYLFFQGIFPEGTLMGALLLWRFLTYYLMLITGLGCVIFDRCVTMRLKKAQALRQNEETQKGTDGVVQKNKKRAGCFSAPAAGSSQEAD